VGAFGNFVGPNLITGNPEHGIDRLPRPDWRLA
jgi:hypothetical protein